MKNAAWFWEPLAVVAIVAAAAVGTATPIADGSEIVAIAIVAAVLFPVKYAVAKRRRELAIAAAPLPLSAEECEGTYSYSRFRCNGETVVVETCDDPPPPLAAHLDNHANRVLEAAEAGGCLSRAVEGLLRLTERLAKRVAARVGG
jgi:hypothetical protein